MLKISRSATTQTIKANKYAKFSLLGLAISLLAGILTNTSPAQAGEIFKWNSQTNGWNQIDGCAKDVGVGANGQAWVIGCIKVEGGYDIYKRTNNIWVKVPGGATHIAVRPNGLPVIVNEEGKIYTGNANGTWNLLPGCAKDIGVGANGQMWVVGCIDVHGGSTPYYWTGSYWQSVEGGITRISVKPNGNPVATNGYNEIFDWNGSRWQALDGRAKDISVGANGSLWVIGNIPTYGGYSIHKRVGSTWQPVVGGATKIAVDPRGKPWLVNNLGDVTAYLPALGSWSDTQWEEAINSADDINAINNNPNSNLGKLYRDLSNDLFGKFFPISGCFICDDYYNATGGGFGWHGGIDIASPSGTAVKSVVNGTVEIAELNKAGWLSIKGDDGKYYIYGHLDTFILGIKVGTRVTKGMNVGTSGARGENNRNAFSPHLHFEVSTIKWGALTTPKPTNKQGFRDRSHNPLKSYWQLRQ